MEHEEERELDALRTDLRALEERLRKLEVAAAASTQAVRGIATQALAIAFVMLLLLVAGGFGLVELLKALH